jgi:hypothetical protein
MKFKTLLIAAISALCASVLVVGAQVPSVNSTLNSVFTLTYDNSTMKPTYSATGTGGIPTTATDFCSLAGSATKTIKVRRILLSAGATAVVTDPVAIIKRSTANAASSGALIMNQVPYDSANSAGTSALAEFFTAAPQTLGTIVGVVADPFVTFSNYTTGISNGPVQLYYGEFGSPIVLRGVAQQVAVNHNASAPSGAYYTCTFEWTEE